MAYARSATFTPKAKLREVSAQGTVDERLDRITLEITKRMEAELDRYSVPQLLSGLHKCLQVRVLLLTLRQKGGGTDVGSSVRKYADNFKTANAGGSRARSARRTGSRTSGHYDDSPDDNVIDFLTDDDIELR